MKVCLPEVLRPRPDGMTFNHQAPKSPSQRYLGADYADRSLSPSLVGTKSALPPFLSSDFG